MASYGADAISARLDGLFGDIFQTDVAVFPVVTGTAANALSISVLSPPFGAVFCHTDGHMHVDACGAPEFFAGGAKLVPVGGKDGRIDADALAQKLAEFPERFVHMVKPSALTVTQATEAGTVYTPDQLQTVVAVARSRGLGIHMDGARFANAIVRVGCSPADVTWRAGIDILSFGATKNGALAAEAVVLFGRNLIARHAERLSYLRKRSGHLLSKLRFVAAQLEAYLADDLWLANAMKANRAAERLSAGLSALPGATLVHPVEANEVFVCLPEAVITALEVAGFGFHRWPPKDRLGSLAIRMVTSFNSLDDDVDALINTAANATNG